jgi:hypothetical protein
MTVIRFYCELIQLYHRNEVQPSMTCMHTNGCLLAVSPWSRVAYYYLLIPENLVVFNREHIGCHAKQDPRIRTQVRIYRFSQN